VTATTAHEPYYSDGYLLEAAACLAAAARPQPEGRRLHPGTLVTIYTAMSAEAHINYAIYGAFAGVQRKELLRLNLRTKLQYVPQLATGKAVFRIDEAPLKDLRELIATRNKLVHANPPVWEIDLDAGSVRYSMPNRGTALSDAARYLSSLCRYLDKLERAAPDTWNDQAWLARELLAQDTALRDWKPRKHRPAMQELVEHLTDYLPMEE
jgi:hypothetical protein